MGSKDIEKIITNSFKKKDGVEVCLKGKQIGYSDGDLKENYIEKVIRETKNLSSNSPELEKRIINWASEYHLTRRRAQLLEGFKFDNRAMVLEIGAGCGAITRFLGENFKRVVAVEGSFRRARINRRRTRDLPNVSVLCSRFQDVDYRQKFKYIFAIGVLEYYRNYIDPGDTIEKILSRLGELLTPDGSLVLAIENQYGLKYFAGHFEDHTGKKFEGIEGYNLSTKSKNFCETFGLSKLKIILSEAGFDSVDSFFPFPDYKVPDLIISEEANSFDIPPLGKEVICNFKARSYNKNNTCLNFDERLAWAAASENRMIDIFSNSFLLFASKNNNQIQPPGLMWFYNSTRINKFNTRTIVTQDEAGKIVSQKVTLDESRGDRVGQGSVIHCLGQSEWADGESLAFRLYRQLVNFTYRDIDGQLVAKVWGPWIKSIKVKRYNGLLAGKYFDFTPWNIIQNNDGALIFFDREWELSEDFPFKFLWLRSIRMFVIKYDIDFGHRRNFKSWNIFQYIQNISREVGILIGRRDLEEYLLFEAKIQTIITGQAQNKWLRKTRAQSFGLIGPLKKSTRVFLGKAERRIIKKLNVAE